MYEWEGEHQLLLHKYICFHTLPILHWNESIKSLSTCKKSFMINISDKSNPMIFLNEKLLKIIVDNDLIYTIFI